VLELFHGHFDNEYYINTYKLGLQNMSHLQLFCAKYNNFQSRKMKSEDCIIMFCVSRHELLISDRFQQFLITISTGIYTSYSPYSTMRGMTKNCLLCHWKHNKEHKFRKEAYGILSSMMNDYANKVNKNVFIYQYNVYIPLGLHLKNLWKLFHYSQLT